MTAESGAVMAVRMPQVNANDEEVTLLDWRVADGGRALEGECLCEIETSKSVGELPSPAAGVLRQVAKSGDVVKVDEIVAFIGPSAEAVDSYLSMVRAPGSAKIASAPAGEIPATAGAIELARKAGVDLARVPTTEARIRRSDVERYLAENPALARTDERSGVEPVRSERGSTPFSESALPPVLQSVVDEVDALPNHQWGMAQHLKETQDRLVVAHAMMDVDMRRAVAWIESQKQAGRMASPLPVLLKAAAAAIAACPKLQSFRMGRRVYRYRSLDIAFTARSHQGGLYTPVVRAVDQLGPGELAKRCSELAMGAFRGRLAEDELAGGCLTVSLLNEQPVRFHVGLQNSYQTALLTAGAIRQEVRMIDDRPVAVPVITLALSYDHGVLDGWDAAVALDAARHAIETCSAV